MLSNDRTQIYNRVAAIMVHTKRYAFKGKTRLAADAGVAHSNISRFLSGQSDPSYRLINSVSVALSKAVGRPIPPTEFASYDGTFPTASCCELVGCAGCLPDYAFDDDNNRLAAYSDAKPGEWSGVVPELPQQREDL